MSGSIRMILGPLKKYINDKLVIDYRNMDYDTTNKHYTNINKSFKRMCDNQAELISLNLDTDRELILENEQLILKTDTYSTDFAYYIEKLKNPQAISDPAIDKIASRLEAMNKNPPSNQDKLAEVLSKIHNEKDDKFVKILDTHHFLRFQSKISHPKFTSKL